MNGGLDDSVGSRPACGLRLKRAALGAGALLVILALATACGRTFVEGSGVATSGSPATTALGSSSGSPTGAGARVNWLPYAECMRAQGIRDFPDPNSQGQLQLHAQPGGDMDPSSPIYRAAASACAALNPVHAANLKYAQCMRVHGIADFPEPNAEGAITLPAHPGGDLDPTNPAFQAAQTACKALQPGGGSPGGS